METSGPQGVDLNTALSVFQGLFVLSDVDVAGGSVGEISMIFGVTLDGLGKVLDSLLVPLVLEGLVAQSLELTCLL